MGGRLILMSLSLTSLGIIELCVSIYTSDIISFIRKIDILLILLVRVLQFHILVSHRVCFHILSHVDRKCIYLHDESSVNSSWGKWYCNHLILLYVLLWSLVCFKNHNKVGHKIEIYSHIKLAWSEVNPFQASRSILYQIEIWLFFFQYLKPNQLTICILNLRCHNLTLSVPI